MPPAIRAPFDSRGPVLHSFSDEPFLFRYLTWWPTSSHGNKILNVCRAELDLERGTVESDPDRYIPSASKFVSQIERSLAMLSFRNRAVRLCDGVNRREWLRVGGLSVLGLSLPDLLAAQAAKGATTPANKLSEGLSGVMFGRAKNLIFLWLQGGPPQHETVDPKFDAPLEIRGPFNPIQTNVPGIQFCELLPRTAQRADKLAVIRSLSTDDNNHDVSGYWVLTGYPYGPGSAREIKPNDWPYFGSVIKMLKPSERLPALTSVWLPDMMRLNDNVTPAGQTGGFLGSLWDPDRFVGDPADAHYRIESLSLPIELPPARMHDRAALLGLLNQRQNELDRKLAGE